MKPSKILVLLGAFALTACVTGKTETASSFESQIAQQGYVAYLPPAGDPANNPADWRKLGPGAIVRKGRPDPVINATHIIGDAGIARARLPAEQTVVTLFSNTTVKDVNLSATGGFAVSEAAKVQAAAELAQSTEVDITFGNTWESTAFDDLSLGEALTKNASVLGIFRNDLRASRLHLVKTAVYTDSLKFRFKQRTATGGSIDVEIPDVQAAKIAAKVQNAKVVNGSVVIDTPRFIGYRPLQEPARYLQRRHASAPGLAPDPGRPIATRTLAPAAYRHARHPRPRHRYPLRFSVLQSRRLGED